MNTDKKQNAADEGRGIPIPSPPPTSPSTWHSGLLWQHHVDLGYKGLDLGDKKTFITLGDLWKMSCRWIKNFKYL